MKGVGLLGKVPLHLFIGEFVQFNYKCHAILVLCYEISCQSLEGASHAVRTL